MKYITLAFHIYDSNDIYFVEIDDGDGMKTYEAEYGGSFFPVGTKSPMKFVSNYCEQNDYEVFQVVEEEAYKHLRFYLKKNDSLEASGS